jgi:hypothetical protein
MNLEVFSYRFAEEIAQHPRHQNAWGEIQSILSNAPLFIYPNKSQKNQKLDVVQQVMNTYFDRVMVIDNGWTYHPLATNIVDSGLKADFKKTFGDLTIQAEIQFGNMSRWYSDVFKFQTAYSQSLIKIGLSIIPMGSLANRIDSNVVNFERAKREPPSAELSLTLPILKIGLSEDENTSIVDISACQFASIREITGKGKSANQWRIVHGFLSGESMENIGSDSPTGPILDTHGLDDTDD